jgi:hypothetical protein
MSEKDNHLFVGAVGRPCQAVYMVEMAIRGDKNS